jgi:hypothetical protein
MVELTLKLFERYNEKLNYVLSISYVKQIYPDNNVMLMIKIIKIGKHNVS